MNFLFLFSLNEGNSLIILNPGEHQHCRNFLGSKWESCCCGIKI